MMKMHQTGICEFKKRATEYCKPHVGFSLEERPRLGRCLEAGLVRRWHQDGEWAQQQELRQRSVRVAGFNRNVALCCQVGVPLRCYEDLLSIASERCKAVLDAHLC